MEVQKSTNRHIHAQVQKKQRKKKKNSQLKSHHCPPADKYQFSTAVAIRSKYGAQTQHSGLQIGMYVICGSRLPISRSHRRVLMTEVRAATLIMPSSCRPEVIQTIPFHNKTLMLERPTGYKLSGPLCCDDYLSPSGSKITTK